MRRYTVQVRGKDYVLDVEELTADTFRVVLDDTSLEVRLRSHTDLAQAQITPAITPETRGDQQPAVLPRGAAGATQSAAEAGGAQLAPMPGVIVSVDVAPGAAVKRGQVVVVLEAMKMNNALRAAHDGIVAEVCVQPGQTVAHGDVLLRFVEA